MNDILGVFRDMCDECDRQIGRPHTDECKFDGLVTKDQAVEKMTTMDGSMQEDAALKQAALDELAKIAGTMPENKDWPVVIINAVWYAKDEDEVSETLDRVEGLLAVILGIPEGIKVNSEMMAAHLARP